MDTYQTKNSKYLETFTMIERKKKELAYLQFQIICDRYVTIQKKCFGVFFKTLNTTLNVYIFKNQVFTKILHTCTFASEWLY